MTNANCIHCQTIYDIDKDPHHSCLGKTFYEDKSSSEKFLSNYDVQEENSDNLANFSFRFESEETGKRGGFLWLSPLYRPYVYVKDRTGKEVKVTVSCSVTLDEFENGMNLQRANEIFMKMKGIIVQRQANRQTNGQVNIVESPLTKGEKMIPYLQWGLGSLIIVFLIGTIAWALKKRKLT
ncbi:MAG: hypothetical protein GBAus27B_000154 [Mycoplasmataceae bacterium]|nr:MAG: hypothetical protein GBAus27B_000154 [Mycoplasmataceae bacterium]